MRVERVIEFNKEQIELGKISFSKRLNFFDKLDKIGKNKDLSDIDRIRLIYKENFKIIEKLSEGKIKAEQLEEEDAVEVDNIIIKLHNILGGGLSKKN